MKTYTSTSVSAMRRNLKLLFAAVLACGFAAAAHAQILSPTGISANPSSAEPGHQVTFNIAVSNSDTGNDFNGTATFNLTLTNITTGYQFQVNQIGTTTALISRATQTNGGPVTPGSGTFALTATVPTQLTQAGNYRASVVMSAPSGTATLGSNTFSVASTVLTITGKPDLQITSLTYSASTTLVGGNIVPMQLTYTNNVGTNGSNNVPYIAGVGGFPSFVRIQVVLSTNPTWGDADDFQLTIHDIAPTVGAPLNATGANSTISWNQLLPGNFSGSYYILGRIDSLDALDENDAPVQTVNGNNVWAGNATNPAATFINLLTSNFPSTILASHKEGASTSAANYSDNPAITDDGRYMVFASDSTDLVSSDSNGSRDIFMYDSQENLIRMVSLSQQGTQGNGASSTPVIAGPTTAGHYYVAFASDATNLILGDTNGFSDIYVINSVTGLITRVSVTTGGTQANNPSFRPSISLNGRFITFESTATNLVSPATTPGVSHVYLHDRDVSGSGVYDTFGNTSTVLVDVSTGGAVANASSTQPAISADGTRVAFTSAATNLSSFATTASRTHVYVRSISAATTTNASVSALGAEANGNSQSPSLSSNGRHIAFASLASDLIAAGTDTNAVSDIFARDLTAGTTVRLSVSSAGAQASDPSSAGFQLGSINPTISSDGRYVAFASLANNLTAGDDNGQAQAQDANDALDIFVRDRDASASGTFDTGTVATTIVSVNKFGYQTNGLLGIPSAAASNIYPVISGNGRFVAFPSDSENNAGLSFGATNLLNHDSNGFRDVFLHDRRTNVIPGSSTVNPTVSITSPGSGSSILVSTPVSVVASATATIGSIARVDFYVNGVAVGTGTNFPYSATWTPSAVGNYILSALAVDTFGNQAVSSNIAVTVTAAPTVSITSPVGGSLVPVGSATTVTASAAASNPGATISSVQFFANGVAIGTDTTLPFSVAWTPASAGSYSLTALATDTVGTTLTSTAVDVSAGSPPSITIASPATGSTLAVNVPVTLVPTVSSTNGTISSVQFFANGSAVGSATAFPFSVTWTPTSTGTYAITAVATDNVGNTTTSASASFSVTAGSAAGVSISSPIAGSSYTVGSSVAVAATVSGGSGLFAGVEFFINGVSIGSSSTIPFTRTFVPAASGSYIVSAVATDISGNRTTSLPVTFGVVAATAPAVAISSPASGSTLSVNVAHTIAASAISGTATIAKVDFFANGALIGTKSTFPYSVSWTPNAVGTYVVTAVATDSVGGVTTSVPVTYGVTAGALPAVTLTSPAGGSFYPIGNAVPVTASASSTSSTIANVQFFANGVSIGSKNVFPYSVSFTPTSTGSYVITAVATDSLGNTQTSSPVTMTIGGNLAPTVTMTNPASAQVSNAGVPITLAASASDSDGTIANVQFLANSNPVGSPVTSTPYTTTFTPTAAGIYSLVARATDNSGNITSSSAVLLVVNANVAPAVTITSPGTGASIVTNSKISVAATATDSDGVVTTVQFFANGLPIGSVSSPPYRVDWTPSADGTYRLTAMAIDNAGAVTTSAVTTVLVASTGGNAAYTGVYQNLIGTAENGRFAMVNLGGSSAILIGHGRTTQAGTPKVYFYPSFTLGSSGGFNVPATATAPLLKGTAIDGAVAGNLGAGLIIGQVPAGSSTVAPGYYAGSLTGNGASTVAAIAAADGSLMLYVNTGTVADAGDGLMDNSGNFVIELESGTTVTGRINPVNGLLTATLAGGSISGTATGGFASASSFSDGTLRNLSTRGLVGRDENVLITGFVIGGEAPKRILIRAVGPALSQSVSSTLANPQLQVFNQAQQPIAGAFNDNWKAEDAQAMRAVGASDLAAGSADSAIVATLPAGVYTTQVSGANGGTGVALVEFFDLGSPDAFSSQKVINVSTRGFVGTGDGILIAGFSISGTSPKKLLIRAVGPALGPLGVGNALGDPTLRIVQMSTGRVVRENDNWEVGNDKALIESASASSGAFPLPTGGKDAAVLLALSPGNYTVLMSGVADTTGVGLVEVYEVP